MKPISESTALVYDNGLFLPLAHCLSKKFKKVFYHCPVAKAFPSLNDYIVGDGFENIECCEDIWKIKNQITTWVFPDLHNSGLQLELESQGYAVWGSRNADSLELNRKKFHDVLAEVGLPVPKFVTIIGLKDLRAHLMDITDRYIKISKYRGLCETFHWRDYDLDSIKLDELAVKLGPAQNLFPFLVFEPIDAPVEVGGDGYCVDGQWPDLMLHGDEDKDKAYLAAVTPFSDMPPVLSDIMEALSPFLKADRYRNQWSMETRDGRFTDITTRGGLPSSASQLNTWSNFPEIIHAGAHGELIQPIPAFKFSAELVLTMKCRKDVWQKIRIDDEVKDSVKLSGCCEIDGAICFPPDHDNTPEVGWLVAGGNTAQEAIDSLHEKAALLPDGLDCDPNALIGLLANIQKAVDDGIDFADNNVPAPVDAVDV